MNMRDRLAELIDQKQDYGQKLGVNRRIVDNDVLADYLIQNDVQVVRHGKWEYIGTDKQGNVFRCSNCALRIGLERETDFCSNCGAKMDKE